jgi:hypothetical protein
MSDTVIIVASVLFGMEPTTLFLLSFAAHLCKPPFRSRASHVDGNAFVGLGASLIYLALSLISLGASVVAVVMTMWGTMW